MSKIKIKAIIKTKDNIHTFEGKGIKINNKITYNDEGIKTTLTLGETIYLERKKDYLIKLGFKSYNTIKGTYIIPEGTLDVETKTTQLIWNNQNINIKYILLINKTIIDEFELNFNFSIDTSK